MCKKKYYWKTKDGKRIDVDEMSIEHLRNTLKMIIRNRERAKQTENPPVLHWTPEFWKD
ncbi:MAG: hypothetical protein GY870_07145 [archaeon]|nr:hypothetical protein [archaeon]